MDGARLEGLLAPGGHTPLAPSTCAMGVQLEEGQMGLSKATGHTPLLPRSSSLTLKHKILNAPFTLTLSSPSIFLQMPLFLTLTTEAVLYYSIISKGIILILFPYSYQVLRKKKNCPFFQP